MPGLRRRSRPPRSPTPHEREQRDRLAPGPAATPVPRNDLARLAFVPVGVSV